MRRHTLAAAPCLVLSAAVAAFAAQTFPPPAGLVVVPLAADSETLWPFTGTGVPGEASDPINLIFQGDADPRQIRQALLALDGDRTAFGFPAAFPFNCTWADAIGRQQTAYAAAEGWQGSSIQMQCGDYASLRFHLRLFREGIRTLGNVHFEALIPGTTDHEVLQWEFAEAFVRLDLQRSGVLSEAIVETDPINPAPSHRTIRPQVYNGLPTSLRAALGLPLANQSAPIPIPTNGRASVFALQGPLEAESTDIRIEFEHLFGQVIPKPFCSTGPTDYLRVDGPIHMIHRVKTNPSGKYEASFTASGVLNVVPVNPLTGQATGPAFQAVIAETHRSSLTNRRSQAAHFILQTLLSEPRQAFFEELLAGHTDRFARAADCGQ